VEFHVRRSSPGLRPYLAELIGYAYPGDPPELHRGLPSRHLTLVIALDEPLGIGWPGEPVSKYQASASGLHHTAVRIGQSPNRSGIQLSLTPAGSRLLLGVPAAELSGLAVDLDLILGPAARRLPDRLTELPDWEQRFAAVEEFLAAAVRRRTPAVLAGPAPEVAWAWRRLSTSRGGAGVQQIADEVGWSRRHLSERFRREYGLTPKVAARVMRFEHAVGRLRRSPTPRLADLAAICGYADQAHLTREWNALAGCPPRQWMAEELPFVQDLGPLDGEAEGHDAEHWS
jgi:AraC-like DNA-binding protein